MNCSRSESKSEPRTASSIRPRNPFSSLTILRVSISTIRTTRSSQMTANRPLSRCNRMDVAADGNTRASSSRVVWKSKNWAREISKPQPEPQQFPHIDSAIKGAGNHEPVQAVSSQPGDTPMLRLFLQCGSNIESTRNARRAGSNVKLLPLQARLHVPHIYQPSRCARQTEVPTRRNARSLTRRYAADSSGCCRKIRTGSYTLTDPVGGPFHFSSASNLNECFPCLLFSKLHDLAKPSSV